MNLLQIHEPGETPLPHEGGAAVGIDLGTTHSVIAIAKDGKAEVLRDVCGGTLVPSAVYYGEDGEKEVGKRARARLQQHSKGVITSIKRQMGRSNSAVEISADILRHMKSLAEEALGQEVTHAVITVPAYFNDGARQATKDAATLAGLEVLRLINEPTAAALAYGLDSGAEGIYAVYDLGGGTFDISILKLEKGVFQVLSTGGDVALGGDDFDQLIAARGGWDAAVDHNALLAHCRALKEHLSEKEIAQLTFAGKTLELSRSEFEAMIAPLVKKTLSISAQAMEDANLNADALQGIVLVGGTTRTPYIRKAVQQFFGKAPLADINPDEVVAVGAAIQAEGLTVGSDNLLLDVVPLSLGLETMGEIVEKIIHRNTPIPVSVSQEFTTYQDGQNAMIIHVLQGEREMVNQNRSLGKFELKGIPPLPAGIARVKVTFTVDADGLLSVSAREETTGKTQSVAVKPAYGLQEGEIEQMLLDSMQHAKSDILERLLHEAVMESNRSIEEVRSALKADAGLLNASERAAIEAQIQTVQSLLDSKDRDRIDYEREQLHHLTRIFAERRMDRAIGSALKGAHINDVANS